MSRQSVAKAHQKIQELAWEPLYHEPVSQYGTDYTFAKAQKKDPLKQVLRSYFPMQEEKDNRVYGALDAALRGGNGHVSCATFVRPSRRPISCLTRRRRPRS